MVRASSDQPWRSFVAEPVPDGSAEGGAVQDGRVIIVRTAAPADVEAVSRLEGECLGVDAWSERLVHEGINGTLPTLVFLVAEVHDEVVGHAVVSTAGDIAELQRIAVHA